MPPVPGSAGELEDLLAEALAKYEEGGETALAAFVAARPGHSAALERGIRRCREMGLLGKQPGATTSHPDRLGDFRLLRRIGSGGMGVVYAAIQEPLGRRVALKIIRPELLFFEGARERFRREVDAVARLEHPAIVSVFSAGEHDGVPYFAMEMLDGSTLDRACERLHGRDPAALTGGDLRALVATGDTAGDATGDLFQGAWWEVAVRIGIQIALGLRHAHLRGIVHRDVKPSNVIVTPHGQAVVLDFGVAQIRAGGDLTRSGAAPGSPAFMSPEQRRGQATDERTDVYSLAATLWQLLALQRPFRDADLLRGDAELRPLRLGNRSVPAELDLVLRTAMDPDRDRRYGEMGQFAADLQAVLARRPIQARPPGLGLRALRWCQRHRAVASAGAATTAAALLMLVVLLLVQDAGRRALQATNSELAVAKTALEAEQLRTQQSLDTALEALHSVQVRLGNERLLAVPQAQKVAHQVLQDAAELFRGLLQRHPGDEDVRWRGGRALQALAMSHERQGDTDTAIAVMREALAVLGTEQVGSLRIRNIRGHAWKTLATFLVEHGDRAGALDAIARAEADFSPATPDRRNQADNLRALGALATTRTFLVDERRDPAAAEALYREALQRQRDCMALSPQPERDPSLLVQHLTNLGKFLQRSGRAEEALPVLAEAMQAAQALPAEGVWPPAFVEIAEVQEVIGNCHVDRGDPAAEQLLRDAVASRERAAEHYPDVLEFKVRLAGSIHNFGRWLYAARRSDEALAEFQRARAIQTEALARAPRHPVALDFLARHLEMIGYCHSLRKETAPLRAIAQELAALPSRDPRLALRVADFLLRAWHFGGRDDETLRDAAMQQLLLAEQRGLTGQQLPGRGFEALQGRDDYAQWRERVGKVQAAK